MIKQLIIQCLWQLLICQDTIKQSIIQCLINIVYHIVYDSYWYANTQWTKCKGIFWPFYCSLCAVRLQSRRHHYVWRLDIHLDFIDRLQSCMQQILLKSSHSIILLNAQNLKINFRNIKLKVSANTSLRIWNINIICKLIWDLI